MKQAKVIAFDGPDGVGKSTQLKLLAEHLKNKGYSVFTTRASGGTAIGEALREASLMNTERPPEVDLYISLAMHTALGHDLQSKRTQYDFILVDRSPLAVIAYQSYGSQLSDSKSGFVASQQLLELWKLDQIIIFTLTKNNVDRRRKQRQIEDSVQGENYFEKRDEAFRSRVQEGYRAAADFFDKNPLTGLRIIKLDASGTIEQVQQRVLEILNS